MSMNTQQALEIIDQHLARLSLTRAEHIRLQVAVQVITQATKPKPPAPAAEQSE